MVHPLTSTKLHYSGDEIMAELAIYGNRSRPPIEETEEIILSWLEGFAYNSMELCRIINGIEPHAFRGCYAHKFGYGTHSRCDGVARGCRICSGAIDKRLRSMQRRGMMKSIKLRWMDGRNPGAAVNSIPLDNFRIYYRERSGLACRLIIDIRTQVADTPDV